MIKKRIAFKKFFILAIFTFHIISLGSLALVQNVRAAEVTYGNEPLDFTPQVGVPGSKFNANVPVAAGTYNDATGIMSTDLMASYVIAFYNYGLAVSGVIATIMLMAAGVIWLTSGGDSGKISQAKDLISGSIAGILILVCAWIILNTINPNLTELKNLDIQIVKKEETSVISCCGSKSGPINFPVDIVNGKKVFASGASKGKPIQCANGYIECKEDETCTNSLKSNTYSCVNKNSYNCCQYDGDLNDVFCLPVLKKDPCPSNDEINKIAKEMDYSKVFKLTLESRVDISCRAGGQNGSCGAGAQSIGESCGNEGGRCYKKCPKEDGWETDLGKGKKCAVDQQCCMNEKNKIEGDCVGTADGSECAKTSDYCYNQVCLKGSGKENERCGVQPGAICKPSSKKITEGAIIDKWDNGDGGRNCGKGLYCYYKVSKPVCGEDVGAKCMDGTFFNKCPDGYEHSENGNHCGKGQYCCFK